MATFTFPYTVDNLTGHIGYKILYRVSGTPIFTSYLTSGTTATIHGLTNNYIYDLEVQNLNGFDNPYSPIVRAIGFTDPGPLISPTNSTVAFSFADLSYFINYYTVSIALTSSPGTILQSQSLSSGTTVSGSFSGLLPLTSYNLNITPVASEFSQTFTHNFVTAESAVCATPILASAYLTSGTIALHTMFTSPAILPAGGFVVSYRTKGTNSYQTSAIVPGTTGPNFASVSVTPYASYEGFVQSSCDASDISLGTPFGTNAYLTLTAVVSLRTNPATFIATITSLYGNPYATLVAGTFISETSGSHSFTATYPANATSATVILIPIPGSNNDTVTSYVINSITPVFDNGGSIQQFDNISTPNYFQFYNILTSGASSWTGNPASLPSFTLDRFEITEQDTSGNVLTGSLLFSWIYDHQFGNGVSPYNTITFEIQDPANSSVMGTVTVSTSPIGLREASVTLTKQIITITPTNNFHLVGRWSDTSAISTVSFYLPVF